MPSRRSGLGCLVVCALATGSGHARSGSGPLPACLEARAGAARSGPERPLTFEANVGQFGADQVGPDVRFIGRSRDAWFLAAPDALTIAIPAGAAAHERRAALPQPAIVRLRPFGANRDPVVVGDKPQTAVVNYLHGRDPAGWHTRVPTFGEVRYQEVYDGIDLVLHARGGALEYDFVVRPGARPDAIALDFEGADDVRLSESGELVVAIGGGELRQPPPTLYQVNGNRVTTISGRYVVDDRSRVRFVVGWYDATRNLVIDPVLAFSSYLGGSNADTIYAVTADAAGNAYVTGQTASTDFTLTIPNPTPPTSGDVFVSKFSPVGTLLYSTYFGGNSIDYGADVWVDAAGQAYVTGSTLSANFPTTPGAFRPGGTFLITFDAFVSKLAADGASLVYSTLLGGSSHDWGRSIAVDAAGQAVVTGDLISGDLPFVNPVQTTRKGIQDVFVARLNANGSALVHSTLLGGGATVPGSLGADWAFDVAVDASGNALIAGWTDGGDFPVANAYDTTLGARDAFLTKLGPNGALVFSTFLGGSGLDEAHGVAIDPAGNVYVVGANGSGDFPVTPGTVRTVPGQIPSDAFLTKFGPGGLLVYSAVFGGTSIDTAYGVAVDQLGYAYVTGITVSSDFPLVSAFQSTISHVANCGFGAGSLCSNLFVARFDPTASKIGYSSFHGGSHNESIPCGTACDGPDIAIDAFGNAWIAGVTLSTNLPTVSPLDATLGGTTDGFLAFVVQDGDRDGLFDDWETEFGLNPSSAAGADGGSGDPDGDGTTNLEELRNGTHPKGFFTRYLAEGAINAFFDVRLALLNTAAGPARLLLRFLQPGGATLARSEVLEAGRRRTLTRTDLSGLASPDFSTVVESDQRVVVDRTMSWDGAGYGSHAESSVPAPATTWYLAEGSTSGDFALFYLLQNPNATATTATVRYLLPGGLAPLERTYPLAASSRTTIAVDGEGPELASTDVSAVITAPLPIIVERAMYMSRAGQIFAAGHGSAGVTAPATNWFLAEGATGPFFDLFILLANPNDQAAQATVDYLLLDGRTFSKSYIIPANGRFTIWVDDEQIPAGSATRPLDNVAVSSTITSTSGHPIIVERAMWWPSPALSPSFWTEAHNSPGATTTGTRWALADGEIGGSQSAETYILIANTSAFAGSARVVLHFEDGTTSERTFALLPRSRTNVSVSVEFPQAAGRRFGSIIESLGATPAQIVVERAMYTSPGGVTWAAGTNALATRLP